MRASSHVVEVICDRMLPPAKLLRDARPVGDIRPNCDSAVAYRGIAERHSVVTILSSKRTRVEEAYP